MGDDNAISFAWKGAAEFADDNTHRLSLTRRWSGGPLALVCGANPSKAGAEKNDPTVHRLFALLRPKGFGGFIVLNWETYIATSPKDMYSYRACRSVDEGRRVVQRNLEIIRAASLEAHMHFVAWGNLVPHVPQTTKVLRALSLDNKHPLYAFGLTKDGSPKHPSARGKHRIPDSWEPLVWLEAAK